MIFGVIFGPYIEVSHMTDEVVQNAEHAVETAVSTEAAKVEAPAKAVEAEAAKALTEVKDVVADARAELAEAASAGHGVSSFLLALEAKVHALVAAVEKRFGLKV
jgi:hypothetical protein